MEKLGNLFEFFVTTGIKSNDQDVLLQACQSANRRDLAILTIFPNPVERKMNPILSDIAQWCFPLGVKVIREGDNKFQKLEQYYKEDDIQQSTNDINYFVINDFKQNLKYYCTSAIFHEKMFLILPPDEKLVQVFVPKAFCVISMYPAFVPQRSFVLQLLKIQRLRLSTNRQRDKVITIQRGNKEYQIEEIKLYDFYIRTALNQCPITQDNVEYRLKFSSQELWMNYHISNSHLLTQASIFRLSNNLFEVLIFNQPLYNLFKLHLYMLLEYQIIVVSRKPAGITLFCQSLIELMAPLQWKGLFIPYLRPGSYDFQKSNLPYLIGLDRNMYEINEKPLPKELKRVIYDLDDARIVTKSDDPKCPKQFQNYFLRKINLVFADLKFYENEYFDEGVIRYRQIFYNFKLLMLNDIYKFYSAEQEDEKDKKVVMFDYKKFLSSFDPQDQHFFLQFLKTISFQSFVKDLYKVMEYRVDFIKINTYQIDYTFASLLQFYDDVRFLSIRFGDQTLDDKINMLENLQNNYIKEVLERQDENTKFKVLEMKTTDFIPEYLEHLKGSSLNLSTEMQALAKYVQVIQREEKEEIQEVQPLPLQKSESLSKEDLSQISSKMSNEEFEQNEPFQGQTTAHHHHHHNNNNPRVNNVQWEIASIANSNVAELCYKINHLNLIKKRYSLRQKNIAEGDVEEERIPRQQTQSLVANIGDRLNLPVNPGNEGRTLSMAARSYFNRSVMPLIGDYDNAEILVNNQDII